MTKCIVLRWYRWTMLNGFALQKRGKYFSCLKCFIPIEVSGTDKEQNNQPLDHVRLHPDQLVLLSILSSFWLLLDPYNCLLQQIPSMTWTQTPNTMTSKYRQLSHMKQAAMIAVIGYFVWLWNVITNRIRHQYRHRIKTTITQIYRYEH